MKLSGFDWDNGNITKCQKHGVTIEAIEDLFSHPLIVLPDIIHSRCEQRFRAIGQGKNGRKMFVVYTMRQDHIRPISARYMHAKEIKNYEKENPDF